MVQNGENMFMHVPRRVEASVPLITFQSVEAVSEQSTQFQALYDRLRSTSIIMRSSRVAAEAPHPDPHRSQVVPPVKFSKK